MSGEDKDKVSNNREFGEGLLNLVKKIIEKLFLLLIPLAVVFVASQVFSSPDFAIFSQPTYINFTIEANSNSSVSNDLWQKMSNYTKDISISACDVYGMKKYEYPIFLNYSFIDEKGTLIKNITQIKVTLKNRELRTGGKGETATITIVGNPINDEYILRFWGRGGGGESYYYAKGDSELARIEWTGREPTHFCTVNILIDREKQNALTNYPESNNTRV